MEAAENVELVDAAVAVDGRAMAESHSASLAVVRRRISDYAKLLLYAMRRCH